MSERPLERLFFLSERPLERLFFLESERPLERLFFLESERPLEGERLFFFFFLESERPLEVERLFFFFSLESERPLERLFFLLLKLSPIRWPSPEGSSIASCSPPCSGEGDGPALTRF